MDYLPAPEAPLTFYFTVELIENAFFGGGECQDIDFSLPN
jgi:hypothetical protein